MPQVKLNNYLRMYRKDRGFSQSDIAFLLGCHDYTHVGRFENSRHLPSLDTLFAYETILGVSARDLFAGVQERAKRKALHRMRLLAKRLARQVEDPALARKLKSLRAIAEEQTEVPRYEPIPKP